MCSIFLEKASLFESSILVRSRQLIVHLEHIATKMLCVAHISASISQVNNDGASAFNNNIQEIIFSVTF